VTRRLTAAILTALAALVWLGLAAPARRERDTARAEFARLRAEREGLRSRVAGLERRVAAGRTPQSGAAAARALRRALLQAAEAGSVEDVRIAASAVRSGRVAATARLSVLGPLDSVLAVADRLSDPASGVLVRRAILAQPGPGSSEVSLDVEGASLRSGP
jgi:hypothetical protein